MDLDSIRKDIDIFLEYTNPEYYVINTGSLVKEDSQVGKFNKNISIRASEILKSYNIKFKEHNADYLTLDEIGQRENIVDAINIAPQLGVNQTKEILKLAGRLGINASDFISKSYSSGKWAKWIYSTPPSDKYKMAILAGHYNFNTQQYFDLYNSLNSKIDVRSIIIDSSMEIIGEYAKYF